MKVDHLARPALGRHQSHQEGPSSSSLSTVHQKATDIMNAHQRETKASLSKPEIGPEQRDGAFNSTEARKGNQAMERRRRDWLWGLGLTGRRPSASASALGDLIKNINKHRRGLSLMQPRPTARTDASRQRVSSEVIGTHLETRDNLRPVLS